MCMCICGGGERERARERERERDYISSKIQVSYTIVAMRSVLHTLGQALIMATCPGDAITNKRTNKQASKPASKQTNKTNDLPGDKSCSSIYLAKRAYSTLVGCNYLAFWRKTRLEPHRHFKHTSQNAETYFCTCPISGTSVPARVFQHAPFKELHLSVNCGSPAPV